MNSNNFLALPAGTRQLKVDYKTSSPSISLRDSRPCKTQHAWKYIVSPHMKKVRWVGREKNEGLQTKSILWTLQGQLIDFGVWSSYHLSNQLSASNGIPSLIELSLAAGTFLTVVDRLPWKSQSVMCCESNATWSKAKALSPVPHFSLSPPCLSPFSRGVTQCIFMHNCISLSVISLRENEALLVV